jgi:hypothetical protein
MSGRQAVHLPEYVADVRGAAKVQLFHDRLIGESLGNKLLSEPAPELEEPMLRPNAEPPREKALQLAKRDRTQRGQDPSARVRFLRHRLPTSYSGKAAIHGLGASTQTVTG